MVRVDAMAVDGRPLKLARRRVGADGVLSLPDGGRGDDEAEASAGPFRHSVRSFIARHARIVPPVVPQLRTWRIGLRVGSVADGDAVALDMDVVEEDVARSRRVYCDHCRVVGWSENPVCGTRYHFIIRNENSPTFPYKQSCSHCGALRCVSELRCSCCSHEMSTHDLEEWGYLQLEDPTHLLHGLVHANGYAHLLRINGRDGGSKILTGWDLMECWDRLCKLLHVRKVSVMDVSKKYGIDLRLLHGVTKGHPWYGNWGYQFGAGSFGHTAETYGEALAALSGVPLSLFVSQNQAARLRDTVTFYMFLSPQRLRTLRDLFRFITQLLENCYGQRSPQVQATDEKPQHAEPAPRCAWKEEDVSRAEEVIIKILRAVREPKWISWRALQGATFRSVGSLELLDYCLKRLAGRRVGDGLVVAVKCNSATNFVEYRLEPYSGERLAAESLCTPSRECLIRDLRMLYNALLNPVNMQPYVPHTVRESSRKSAAKLLDCKQFIKHYDKAKDFQAVNPFVLRVWCHIELVDRPKGYLACPPELLLLPLNATVADLKLEASKAFQETYPILQSFHAVKVLIDGEYVHDATQVSFLLGANDSVQVRGFTNGGTAFNHLRMERGTESWTVDCTRCSGIKDHDEVPTKFVCSSCARMPKHRPKGRRVLTSHLDQEVPRC